MTKQDRAKLLALCDELEQLAAKATPGPWSVESCGEKGDGSNMVGVAFGPDDSKCERQLSGWLPPFDDDGEDIEYYRDELIADCEHSNRNSNFDAQYIAACDPQSISTLARALKHFLEAAPMTLSAYIDQHMSINDVQKETLLQVHALIKHGYKFITLHIRKDRKEYHFAADWLRELLCSLDESAPHRYGSATLEDMAELEAAPALQEDTAMDGKHSTGIAHGPLSLPPVATAQQPVTREQILEQIKQHVRHDSISPWSTNVVGMTEAADAILALLAAKGGVK